MKNRRTLIIAGIGVLLAAVLLTLPRGETDKTADTGKKTSENRPSSSSGTRPGRQDSRGGSSAPAREERTLSSHKPEALVRFVIPLTEARDVTLKGAVGELMRAYKDACHLTRAQALALEIDLPANANKRISFSLENVPFQAALAHIAALAGFTVDSYGLSVSFAPASDDKEIQSRVLRTMPGFNAALTAQLRRQGITHDGTIAGMAAAAGLIEAGSAITLTPISLTFNGTLAEALRLETRIACMVRPIQSSATVKLIHSDRPLDIDLRTAEPAEIRDLLETLANQPGVKVTVNPKIMIRDSHPGEIAIVTGDATNWTGTKISLEVQHVGLATLAKDRVEYRPEASASSAVRNSNQGVYLSGEPQISLVGVRDGDHLYRMITLEDIDATGVPLGQVATPVPGKPGFVTSPHSGNVIDVQGIPSGTLVADPTFPPEERKFFRVP